MRLLSNGHAIPVHTTAAIRGRVCSPVAFAGDEFRLSSNHSASYLQTSDGTGGSGTRRASGLDMNRLLLVAAFSLATTCGASAAPLSASATRSSAQDLEVTAVAADGTVSPPRYYSYEQLSTLPQVTVQTEKDPNTGKSATYTGVLVSNLFAAFGATPQQDVLGMTCYDHYTQYYDADYDAKHQPILLLKFDGLPPAKWPQTDQNTPQGPYSVVYQKFVPSETIYGYVQPPRIPFGVVKAQLLSRSQAYGPFAPKTNATDPQVQKGYTIAMGSCISCHNAGDQGGTMAMRPWSILAIYAATNSDHFRSYVVNPQKFNPTTKMPAHPTFDDKTLDALQAYFKTMAP